MKQAVDINETKLVRADKDLSEAAAAWLDAQNKVGAAEAEQETAQLALTEMQGELAVGEAPLLDEKKKNLGLQCEDRKNKS